MLLYVKQKDIGHAKSKMFLEESQSKPRQLRIGGVYKASWKDEEHFTSSFATMAVQRISVCDCGHFNSSFWGLKSKREKVKDKEESSFNKYAFPEAER